MDELVKGNGKKWEMDEEEMLEYSHTFKNKLISFLHYYGYDTSVVSDDKKRKQNGKIYNYGYFHLENDDLLLDSTITPFIDCDFYELSKATKEEKDFIFHLAILKDSKLDNYITVRQCKKEKGLAWEVKRDEKNYWSLQNGYQDTKKETFPYSTVMTDSKEVTAVTNINIISLPTTDNIHLSLKTMKKHWIKRGDILVASESPIPLLAAKVLSLDTCLIHNGHNDTVELRPTYEVSSIKQIQKIKRIEKRTF